MTRKNKNALIVVLQIFIIPFVIVFTWIVLSTLFGGCKTQIVEPEIFNLSGRYESYEGVPLKVFLEQTGTHIEADALYNGLDIQLTGTVDTKKQEIILRDAFTQITMDLKYDTNKYIWGSLNQSKVNIYGYYEVYSFPVNLKFVGKLNKSITHQQGAIL